MLETQEGALAPPWADAGRLRDPPGLGDATTIGACIVLAQAGWLLSPKVSFNGGARRVPGQPAGANPGRSMSRWSEAFDAIRARDTVDTIDTMPRVRAFGPHTVNSVNCVNQGKDANAVVTASPQISATEPVLVEQTAEAMIANPDYQITNPETATASG
jgi:hypothetical protein